MSQLMTIVSGIQPTGNLHIGNYLGAVKNWIELQNNPNHECYFFIADYHSLTGNITAEKRRSQIRELAVELLALGLDRRSSIFVQSEVPEHTELSWIFTTLTPLGELFRMTQFKSKTIDNSPTPANREGDDQFEDYIAKTLSPAFLLLKEWSDSLPKDFLQKMQEQLRGTQTSWYEDKVGSLDSLIETAAALNSNFQEKSFFRGLKTGLLSYPVLQAADILIYGAKGIPVGQDQVQHVELTRDIARWFNNEYGNYFEEPKALLTETPKVMSLTEPTKKMSKSHGLDTVLQLSDEPEELQRKLKKAVTATEGGAGAPGVQNLLDLLMHFGSVETHTQFVAAEKDGSIRYGDLKAAVADAVGTYFADFRARRKELLANPAEIDRILADGAERARVVAQKTMGEVRKLVGIR